MYAEHTAVDFREHYDLPEDYIVEGVLAYGTWDLAIDDQLPLLRLALENMGIAHEINRLENRNIGHGWDLLIGGRHYWYIPVMGTAVMAQYLHVACVLGSRRNILLGIVGGLAKGMVSSDFICPTEIEGNDNAAFYATDRTQRRFKPDVSLRASLLGALTGEQHVWEGATITCEMMLAETRADVERWGADGYLGVEMEGALTFALSRHFGVSAAALFYVADNLVENETMLHPGYASRKSHRLAAREAQYRAGVRALLGLTGV